MILEGFENIRLSLLNASCSFSFGMIISSSIGARIISFTVNKKHKKPGSKIRDIFDEQSRIN
jgi:hypothetical protein